MVVHFLVGGRMSIVELKIVMIGFRQRYFRPMHSGAADPKGRGNCTQRVGSIERNFMFKGVKVEEYVA
jgi:hypothetical protein